MKKVVNKIKKRMKCRNLINDICIIYNHRIANAYGIKCHCLGCVYYEKK